jgi:hypothetical protein
VELLLGKYVMEAEARRKDMVHNVLLKVELEVWKTYPRGVPLESGPLSRATPEAEESRSRAKEEQGRVASETPAPLRELSDAIIHQGREA